jgi:AcrR family transcriptional regulator
VAASAGRSADTEAGGPEADAGFDLIWARKGRGARERRPALSREQVVKAAIELADERGLEGMSTRRIAARLGTGPTSMYWHVPSKDDLHELMFDAAMGELELPERPSGDWRADLRALARLMHALLGRHRWLVLLGVQPGIGPNTRRYGEFGIAALAGLGIGRERAVGVLAMVNNYVFGFAHRQTAWEQLRRRAGFTEQDWAQRLDRYLARARREDPELAGDIEARMRLASEDSFDSGLECLIEGIAVCLGQAGDGPQSTR